MNPYRPIQDLRTSELFVKRIGFWRPEMALTDGQFEFGRLIRPKVFSSERIVETAEGSWLLRRAGIFSKEIEIFKHDEKIGSLKRNTWDNRQTLQLHTGFTALFVRKPGTGIFSRQQSWVNDQYGELVSIKSMFSFKTNFKVNVIDMQIKQHQIPLLLLTFLGIDIIIRRQERAAAASA